MVYIKRKNDWVIPLSALAALLLIGMEAQAQDMPWIAAGNKFVSAVLPTVRIAGLLGVPAACVMYWLAGEQHGFMRKGALFIGTLAAAANADVILKPFGL